MHGLVLHKIFGWGLGLWFLGYLLGFALYALVPPQQIGWWIAPIGIAATVYVLLRRAVPVSVREALLLGVGWCLIAIVCDYLFLVRLLQPADGYYKFDVYIYYLSMFLLPPLVWVLARRK